MDIFLWDNKQIDILKLPVVPESIEVQSPQKIETFEALGQGELKIIGIKGTLKLTLESFFPVKDYPFLRDRSMKGMEYVEKIERWRDTRTPLIILIDDMKLTFFCVIENASYSIQDGSGDVYYKLDIEQYKTPMIKKLETQTKITTSEQNQGKPQPSNEVDYLENAYGIVTAESGLNVRSGNGIGYDKIGVLSYNEKIRLYRLEEDGKWWHIYYNNGSGHVSADYVRRI